jgi:sugar phosphate isomerase/epimerase
MEEKLKLAVFIDFDNIEIGVKSTLHREFDVAAVLDALKERGEIVTCVAYANWGRLETRHARHDRARRADGAARPVAARR